MIRSNAILATILLLIASGTDASRASQPERPNLLWITAEDLSPRLGCYGDDTLPTPNLDRLAAEGVRYTNAYATTGVCAPARHAIITGLFPTESGAQYMRTGSRSSAVNEIRDPVLKARMLSRPLYEATPPAGVRCFTEWLRMAGYYCTNNSKQDYQFKAPVTAWDESSPSAHYRNRAPGQPFFAVFNSTVTHESRLHGTARNPNRVDPASVRVPAFLPDTPTVRADIARQYNNLAVLDAWVGKLLDELDDAGLRDSTYAFFFTDHGDGLPRHKRWVYDSGTRVPLLVRYPDGGQAGEVDRGLVSFVDLAPTALAIAGVERPAFLRGRVIAGPDAAPAPEYVFMHRDRMDDASFETIRSVRTERFRYVRNYRPWLPYLQPIAYRDRAKTMGEVYRALEDPEPPAGMWQWAAEGKPLEELYEPASDPDEVVNLASKPELLDELVRLRRVLDEWTASTNDPLATPEREVLATRIWPPDGEQPKTAEPKLTQEPGTDGQVRVTLRCATEGASLGYRPPGEEIWRVYRGPFSTSADRLEVVAHRIGWKPSPKTISMAEDRGR